MRNHSEKWIENSKGDQNGFFKWKFKSQIYWLKTTVGQDENICFKPYLGTPNLKWNESSVIYSKPILSFFSRDFLENVAGCFSHTKGPKNPPILHVIFLSLLKQYNIFIQGTYQNLTCKHILVCLWHSFWRVRTAETGNNFRSAFSKLAPTSE